LQVALRCRTRRPASDSPTSTFDRPLFSLHHVTHRPSPEVSGFSRSCPGAVGRSRPCGFEISVSRLACWAVCGTRRLGTITVHAGPTGSCVAVSLRRDVPLPVLCRTLSQPGRTPAFRLSRASRAATLMGFSHPSQSSPSAGPGVCDRRRPFLALAGLRRSSPPAVIEFTSRR